MYRILIFSLLCIATIACQSDKKAQQSDSNKAGETTPIPAIEEPVVVNIDDVKAAAANKPKIDPNITIREVKGGSELTKKGVYIPEKANARPNIAPNAFAYADLKTKSFKAMGNEPFWNIEIKGNELIFHQLGFEKEIYSLSPSQAKSDRLIYTAQSGSGKQALQLDLMKQKCEDDMSGEPFGYAVILNKDGKEFRGCAKEIFK